jgi:alpha-L-rhamnosidase
MRLYNKNLVFIFAVLLLSSHSFGQVHVLHLLCDNRFQPLGLGNLQPRFSWQLAGEDRNIYQTAYEIWIGRDKKAVLKGQQLEWSSGKVNSTQSVHVKYDGPVLAAGVRYYWQVRVWDEKGKASGWSSISYWEMGLLKLGDWKARWIGPGYEEDSVSRPSPLFRRQFMAKEQVVQATLYITAHGLYEARLNGQRVSDERFAPGYTEYDHRLQYQAYDVTQLIHKGSNTAGVVLGDGWYRGVFGPRGTPNNYGKDASLLYQLVITYKSGQQDTIISDDTWKSSTGGIRYADFYYGEIYDARLEPVDWMQNGFDDSRWLGVKVRAFSKNNLVASIVNPVKEQEILSSVRMLTSPKGEKILDFGQNLAGWVRCRLRGSAGDTIRIFHAEVLDKEGNFYTVNLRDAKAEDTYILKGNGEEEFEPHFTFHGFRYIKLEGYKGDIRPGDFQSVALYSDLPATGHFHCSDSMVNRLQQNIVWSQQSNFIDFPTDCPQRAERQGWLGDAQVFTATAAFNKRVDNFFAKWLQDLTLAQGPDGGMPDVVPDIRNHVWHRMPSGVAGWGDASVIVPWTLFEIYNDTSRLAESYGSMRAWVGYIKQHSVNGLWKGGGFGDWLAPDPVIKAGGKPTAATPTDLAYISQCFYYYSSFLLSKVAGVLGKREDSLYYSALKDTAKAAFLREYMTPDSRAISNTQAAYVLPLYMGILPPPMATRCVERLVALIHANQDHLGTGFLATPYLCFVLTQYGYTDLAYTLLKQTTMPSWLHPVKMGATTMWEKWGEIMPDSSISEGSFNHYAYGAIGNWLYRVVGGISPGIPGYQKIVVHPHIGGGLSEADASYESDYGLIRCAWQSDPGQLKLEVEIPANTRAEVWIPTGNAHEVREGGKPLSEVQGLIQLPSKENSTVVEIGSGKYTIVVNQ